MKCVVPSVNLDLIKKGLKGEDEVSSMVQNMGLEYQKSKEGKKPITYFYCLCSLFADVVQNFCL